MIKIENPKVRDLHPVIWLGVPLASLAIRFIVPLAGWRRWHFFMREEQGFMELAPVAFLLLAFVLGVLIFIRRRKLPRFVGVMMLLAALAALYFAGEEASWGQHLFGFETPEGIKAINEQDEFNLHNISNVFNNLPRQMMGAACIAAIILPVVLRRRLAKPGSRKSAWHWLIPNYRIIPIALMAEVLRLPHNLGHIIGKPLPGGYISMAVYEASGEFKEYCFALVILFYMLSVFLRMGPRKSIKAQSEPD